jgi:hypothetical protein
MQSGMSMCRCNKVTDSPFPGNKNKKPGTGN